MRTGSILMVRDLPRGSHGTPYCNPVALPCTGPHPDRRLRAAAGARRGARRRRGAAVPARHRRRLRLDEHGAPRHEWAHARVRAVRALRESGRQEPDGDGVRLERRDRVQPPHRPRRLTACRRRPAAPIGHRCRRRRWSTRRLHRLAAVERPRHCDPRHLALARRRAGQPRRELSAASHRRPRGLEPVRAGDRRQRDAVRRSPDRDLGGRPRCRGRPPRSRSGDRVDPSGNELKGQHDPVVGAKGIFWLDERDAAAPGNADVYRANLAGGAPLISRFWTNPTDYEAISPRATGEGAAWLGPGIAGGPYEPWVKKPGGGAGIITTLSAPWAFDVNGMRFAVTGGHGGNTSGDEDIFFYDKVTKQNVPVCNVGDPNLDWLKIQTTPTISYAPGGSRVIWADSRQRTNNAGTDHGSLAYELYVALVPTVKETASRTTLHLGQTLKLGTTVTPNFKGKKVKFQKGKRHSWTHPWLIGGKQVWYTNWTTLKTKKLANASKASWTWKPTKKGTYWVRAWFVGGKKYTDVGSRKVPHVPNTSKVIKIVVK